MGTLTHTPAQSNFASRFTLNYPSSHRPDIGCVVGPNWCKEFFVVTGYERVVEPSTEHTPKRSFTRAILEQLTKDRQELLTVENRRDFVAMKTAEKGREMASGFQEVPGYHEIRQMKEAFKNALVIDMVVSVLQRKKDGR